MTKHLDSITKENT